MAGGGTTLVEAKLLNRRGIGIDINPKSIELIKNILNFESESKYEPDVKIGDIRNLGDINENSIDLIVTHPPYLNIIKYSEGKIEGDLSNISSLKKFCDELELGIKEFYRVLKEDSYCAILIGDTRRAKHYIPLSYYVMQKFLDNNFVLKEDIIKAQHNCESTPYWKGQAKKLNIYLIAHEHLYVFRKPREHEDLSRLRYSRKIN
ncbi:putative DNA methylase [Methanocella paludicola SANAE]|uniref:DNA methylase n=2 Tax=Methanocella TaxID=570266 RepID=D1YZ07_METPS|nr:putative DNA methylase [Methanocella paludicola SANAE]